MDKEKHARLVRLYLEAQELALAPVLSQANSDVVSSVLGKADSEQGRETLSSTGEPPKGPLPLMMRRGSTPRKQLPKQLISSELTRLLKQRAFPAQYLRQIENPLTNGRDQRAHQSLFDAALLDPEARASALYRQKILQRLRTLRSTQNTSRDTTSTESTSLEEKCLTRSRSARDEE